MPSRAFSLQVPADAKYAEIAADAARKFVELMGGVTAEGDAFAHALSETVQTIGGGSDVPIEFAFSLQPHGVQVVVTAGSRAFVVRHAIAAGQP